jgi:hypothetical protein
VAGRLSKPPDSDSACARKYLRWDRSNIADYYILTRELLYPIYDKMLCILSKNEYLTKFEIETYYSEIINSLLTAADQCIAFIPQRGLKHWWNSELNASKIKSFNSHKAWLDAGKPLYGLINELKNRDKLNYKLAIKKEKNAAKKRYI